MGSIITSIYALLCYSFTGANVGTPAVIKDTQDTDNLSTNQKDNDKKSGASPSPTNQDNSGFQTSADTEKTINKKRLEYFSRKFSNLNNSGKQKVDHSVSTEKAEDMALNLKEKRITNCFDKNLCAQTNASVMLQKKINNAAKEENKKEREKLLLILSITVQRLQALEEEDEYQKQPNQYQKNSLTKSDSAVPIVSSNLNVEQEDVANGTPQTPQVVLLPAEQEQTDPSNNQSKVEAEIIFEKGRLKFIPFSNEPSKPIPETIRAKIEDHNKMLEKREEEMKAHKEKLEEEEKIKRSAKSESNFVRWKRTQALAKNALSKEQKKREDRRAVELIRVERKNTKNSTQQDQKQQAVVVNSGQKVTRRTSRLNSKTFEQPVGSVKSAKLKNKEGTLEQNSTTPSQKQDLSSNRIKRPKRLLNDGSVREAIDMNEKAADVDINTESTPKSIGDSKENLISKHTNSQNQEPHKPNTSKSDSGTPSEEITRGQTSTDQSESQHLPARVTKTPAETDGNNLMSLSRSKNDLQKVQSTHNSIRCEFCSKYSDVKSAEERWNKVSAARSLFR